MNYSVSIIIPARNEAGMINKLINDLPTLGSWTELIFVENNSTDNTLETLKETINTYQGKNRIKFISRKTSGKKEAVFAGFDAAGGDILMIYDADMTVPAEELTEFYEAITNGRGQFINGSRMIYQMKNGSMRFFNILGNKFYAFIFSLIMGQKVKDTLCGTKVFWRKDWEHIKRGGEFLGDLDKWGDFNLLLGAAKSNLKILDLPVHYRERTWGRSNMNRWQYGLKILKIATVSLRELKFF